MDIFALNSKVVSVFSPALDTGSAIVRPPNDKKNSDALEFNPIGLLFHAIYQIIILSLDSQKRSEKIR